MRKSDKKVSSKYLVLGIIFIVTMVLTFLSMSFESVTPSATTMSAATIPVITMQSEEGNEFNSLHGFTQEINQALINDNLTPVAKTRQLPIIIHNYGAEVQELTYKIRNLSDNGLIENTKVTELVNNGETITATLNIKNLIDDNTQYALEIILETSTHEEIHYYTRIITGEDYSIDDKFAFVEDFNACTFNQDRLSEIQKYIETSSAGNNNNFGKVNINSTLSQIGWGDMGPYVESQLIPVIKEISKDVAVITFDYKIGAINEYESYDSYNVYEYYRIRQTTSGFYLLNYEREANQIFDGKNDLLSTAKINLGIQSGTTAEFNSDEKGTYSYFVNEGSLWCYNIDTNMYTRVFSFNADETDGIRENYNQHGIKILNVSNDGNCDFIVYGYMNRGEHEGESGVSLCKYSYEDNIVEERLYIPMDKPYDTFYILMDDTLYSIDIVSKEVMTVVSGLVDGTYAVSENGDAIAYSMNGRLYSTDSIRIFNMSTDSEKIIKADDNEYIRCLGYINGDFVYGIADKADILIKEDGSRTFAMYRLEIMDSDYNVIKEYEQPGVYVSDASVSDMRINLTRVMKSGDGDYESTSIDQLINKDENKQEDGLTLETIVTDNRKQELAIKLMKALPAGSVEFRTSSEVSYKDNALLELDNDFAGDGRYYVYGYGRFQDSTTQISKAIILANDTYGSVNDYNANTIWKRYRNTSAQIKGLSIIDAGSSLRTALQTVASYAGAQFDINAYIQDKTADEILSLIPGVAGLSVKSVTVDKMLNFIDNGCPVIGKSGSESYVIITGYDSKNVTYIDTASNSTVTVALTDASKMFNQWENVFITYYKN